MRRPSQRSRLRLYWAPSWRPLTVPLRVKPPAKTRGSGWGDCCAARVEPAKLVMTNSRRGERIVTSWRQRLRTFPKLWNTPGGAICAALPPQLLERCVPDPVRFPVLVVEVPPLRAVHGESLRLHRAPKQLPEPALPRGPSGIGGIGAARHLVVDAGHLDRAPALELVEGEIHRAAPVVARAGGRVGHELVLGRRRRLPEHFREVPGAIRVVDEQAVAHRTQLPMGAHQRLRRGALHEGPRLAVERRAEEVPGGGVADVEPDGGIEPHQLHQVGLPELAGFGRRRGGERLPAELLDRPRRHDPEDRALLGPERPARPERIPDRNGAGPAGGAEAKAHLGMIAGPRRSEPECVVSGGVERSEERRVGKECRSRWSPY